MVQTIAAMLLILAPFTQSNVTTQAQVPSTTVSTAASFRISGTVVDAVTGQPLSNAQVLFAPANVEPQQSAFTGDDGRFAFDPLAQGKYVISASRKGYITQSYKQHDQFSTAIIVGPNLVTENLRFELRPAASIEGEVRDERNEPVRNARVILFHQTLRRGRRANWRERETGTDDRGRYRLGHLSPGVYFLAVSAQPWYAQRMAHQRVQQTDAEGRTTYQEFTTGEPSLDLVYPVTFFSHAEDISGAAPVTLHPGDAEVADFFLQPIPALHVLIHSASLSENESVYAQVTQTLGNGSQMQVAANTQQIAPGLLEISGLPPGKLRLGLVASKEGESSTRWRNVDLAGDMDISASETRASATLRGVAKFDSAVSGRYSIMLRLNSTSANEAYNMQADENGEFSLKGTSLPPGNYDLLVVRPAAAAVKYLSATGAKVNGHSLEVGERQDVRLSVVLSSGTGHVSGVAKKDGKPIDGVMVVLVPENPEQNPDLFRRDQSDSDGSFNLNGVVAGKYTIVAIENAWELEWSSPAVIQKYLHGGKAVNVEADARIDTNVNVQP